MQPLLDLTDDLLTILKPITRDRYDYIGSIVDTTSVNTNGIDLHVGQVGQVAHDNAGTEHPTAHHYMVLWPHAGVDRHERLSGGTSLTTWGFQLTVASGTFDGAQWALSKVRAALSRARLNPRTGLLTPYFDQVNVMPDDEVSPPRWYAPLRYSTTVH